MLGHVTVDMNKYVFVCVCEDLLQNVQGMCLILWLACS